MLPKPMCPPAQARSWLWGACYSTHVHNLKHSHFVAGDCVENTEGRNRPVTDTVRRCRLTEREAAFGHPLHCLHDGLSLRNRPFGGHGQIGEGWLLPDEPQSRGSSSGRGGKPTTRRASL